MPNLVIPLGFAQCIVPLNHLGYSRTAVITFGIRNETGAELDAAEADDVFAAVNGGLLAGMDGEVEKGPITLYVGTATGENLVVTGSVTDNAATNIATPSPQVAVLVQKRTARGGGRGRGRMYVPWMLNDGTIDDLGRIDAGTVTLRQADADATLASLVTNQTPMVVLHSSGGVTTPGVPDTVTALTIDSVVSTQKRRLVR
jgi:hypothetical protein